MARNEKEALVLLLDVGISMSTQINVNSTYLQTCVDMIQMIIQRKMFQTSKDEIGLILFGSNETANDLWDGENYGHISIAKPISEVDWKLLDYVQKNIRATNIEGDVYDALIVAADHLHNASKDRKYNEKRILMLTDFSTTSSDEDIIGSISSALRKEQIQLDVISPFDELDDDEDKNDDGEKHREDRAYNDEYNDNDKKSKNKLQKKLMTEEQIKNQQILTTIASESNGSLRSFDEVLTFLSLYQSKSIKSTGTKYTLEIGNNFKLPIVSMIKVKESKPDLFRFKKVYAKDESVSVKIDHARFTKDDEQRDLDDKSEIVDAFRYGTTYVPIDNPDLLRYPVEKCFSVLGFTNADNVKRYYYVGDSVQQILPDSSHCNEDDQCAFLSMVESMYDEKVYGIVRKVFSSRSSPEMGCLIPYIDNKLTCLLYMELPYEDDVRKFPLENFCLHKKFKPNEEQLNLVDNLIDCMDLKNLNNDNDDDEDGDDVKEAYNPNSTFNPYIQRMFQTIALKGTDPNADLPDFENHITANYLRKFDDKIRNETTKNVLKRCAEAFPTKVVEIKKAKLDATEIFSSNKKEDTENDKKPSDINIDDLYSTISNTLDKVTKIGTINPVNDFNTLLKACDSDTDYTKLFEQLIELLKQFLSESMQQGGQENDVYQTKCFDCIKSLKEACIEKSKQDFFNNFLKDFKIYLFESNENKKYLNKIRLFFRNFFIASKLTLLTTSSNDNDDDTIKFLELPEEVETTNIASNEPKNEDVEDLLDMM
jgi:ATP-dependent DNA helicase 2 subunit 2